MELMITVKKTVNKEKKVRPINIWDKSGLVSVFGRLSERINKKTIIDNITVVANEIRSPESQGTIKLISIKKLYTIKVFHTPQQKQISLSLTNINMLLLIYIID